MSESAPLSAEDVTEFLHSGVSILVGTADASLCPETTRAVGVFGLENACGVELIERETA